MRIMSWEDILKKVSKTRMFLYESFDIPVDIPLNIPHNFLSQFSTPSNEGLITEERFEELMKKEPQEIIDVIKGWMDEAVKERNISYLKTPKYRENKRLYDKKRRG